MKIGLQSRTLTYRQKILALLRECGSKGITNLELNANVCMRFGTRSWELRRLNFNIETPREGEAVFKIILRKEPTQPKPLPRFEPRPRDDDGRIL